MYPVANSVANVRKIGKLVDEVISLMLVRAVINDTARDSDRSNVEEAV